MSEPQSLPPEFEAYRQRYQELFGFVPPLPEARLQFAAAVDPEHVRLVEALRAQTYYSSVLDVKTTQMMLFGMLLAMNESAARYHALAARRAGATWEELHQVVELAGIVRALGPLNIGGALLHQLRHGEENGQQP
jgi:alkylhydroperoxidase/carboxymuconolactone decarboxylase family protein YurZ